MQESAYMNVGQDRVSEGVVTIEGEPFYLIDDVDAMDPFLMSVVGNSDVWLFLASNGALTGGRRDPDHAVFPYYTEDKVLESRGTTGGVTLVRVPVPATGETTTWEPGGELPDALGSRRRWLAKSLLGDEVILGEDRPDAGLSFQVSWRTSGRFGLVRRCRLRTAHATEVVVLDGFRNLVPAEATRQVQNELSVLLDAYQRSEIVGDLGLFTLGSRLSDRAEPAEALRATVAWRLGPPAERRMANTRQLEGFRMGAPLTDELDTRGLRGAFLATFTAAMSAEGEITWTTVADTGLDTARATDLAEALADPQTLGRRLNDDLTAGRNAFRALLAGCDALQSTGDAMASAHHLASVTFNAMRGGVPLHGARVDVDHLRTFFALRNRDLAAAAESLLACLPVNPTLSDVRAAGRASGDPDLERLTLEFLPLTFGRRHGDPSRPWNRFEIVLSDEAGQPAVGYQGNWRDIFQNWEALAWSYPELVESMVAAFVGATTVDGYNPYRVTHAGLDWEEPEPENPWANIGYWSDHQIVYLARLLTVSRRFHPGALEDLLDRRIFATADVPYRIAGLEATLADPTATIAFDTEANGRARSRQSEIGGDGLLRRTSGGGLHRSTLADKLLLLVAAKVVNFVPDAGIWMNTQRPEWNDANNALVGRGASVVTTAQLLGFVDLLGDLLRDRDVRLRVSLADLLADVSATLAGTPAGPVDDTTRRTLVDALGRAGERYRDLVYAAADDNLVTVPAGELTTFLGSLRAWLVATLRSNRRPGGLFHSYNTLAWDDGPVRIHRLPLMLEGQVAVLGSGLLDPAEVLELAAGLRASDLYRADQHSYLLYPDRDLAGFLARNTLPERPNWRSLAGLLADPALPIVVPDAAGGLHFAADLSNAGDLAARLDALASDPRHQATIVHDRAAILEAYENVFRHRGFMGRSGSFFAYEGLGSIYWHMVSKLALALREVADGVRHTESADTVALLDAAYADVRAGLGFCKDAVTYGAVPTDPYSHTPRHSGARQPGMTGQVKEDILCRFAELGVRIDGGEVWIDTAAIGDDQWCAAAHDATIVDPSGAQRQVHVPAGCLLFTLCQVPFLVGRGASVEVDLVDGTVLTGQSGRLPAQAGRSILARDGRVRLVRVGCSG